MFEQVSSPTSTLVDAAFHSMEEVNEVARATGWQGDYRQLGKGPVTSRWRSLHVGPSSLVSHQLDNRVHARVAPPAESVALAVMTPPSSLLIEGAEFGIDQALVADAETDIVVPGDARCDTLVVPRLVFAASLRALFPRMSTNGELLRIISCPHSGWSALQTEIGSLLRDGCFSPEDLSLVLCRFLDLMAGHGGKHAAGTCLGNGSGRVARLARDYIEGRYSNPIRMEDLCRFTGVSLRTLQRSFSNYFQMSPSEYLKARRLNAARRALVTGSPSRDRVTRVALDNGFTHLGRFSVDYRRHFGESPRETLTRS